MWDDAGIAVYQEAHFEKTLLFTDRTDWSPAPTVAAYRGQGSLENGFRQMKAPHFVTVSPMFHWTDSKIRVHEASCVLAWLLASLLHREARAVGFAGGLDALLETLADLRLVVDRSRPLAARNGRRCGSRNARRNKRSFLSTWVSPRVTRPSRGRYYTGVEGTPRPV